MAQCAAAIRDASGLPVQVQIEPPDDFSWFAHLKDNGIEALGLHLETFDEEVLARIAPGKARPGARLLPGRLGGRGRGVRPRARCRRISSWDWARSRESVVEGCQAAIDRGVYPFVVPLRPSPGSLLADHEPPSPEYMRDIYEMIAPLLAEAGIMSQNSRAGCVRCQACSALSTFEQAFGGGRSGNEPVDSDVE